MGAEVAVGATAVSTVYTAYSSYQEGKERQKLYNEQAAAKREQALELEKRFKINEEIMARKGQSFIQDQMGAFAKGGIDVSSTSALLKAEQTNYALIEEAASRKADFDYNQSVMLTEAKYLEKAGFMEAQAGKNRAISTVFQGAASSGKYA